MTFPSNPSLGQTHTEAGRSWTWDGYVWLYEGQIGPPGPPGTGGGGRYEHVQMAPAAVWNITHGLGYRPSVTVIDTAETVCIGSVEHIDANNLTITFSAAFAGRAHLV